MLYEGTHTLANYTRRGLHIQSLLASAEVLHLLVFNPCHFAAVSLSAYWVVVRPFSRR